MLGTSDLIVEMIGMVAQPNGHLRMMLHVVGTQDIDGGFEKFVWWIKLGPDKDPPHEVAEPVRHVLVGVLPLQNVCERPIHG